MYRSARNVRKNRAAFLLSQMTAAHNAEYLAAEPGNALRSILGCKKDVDGPTILAELEAQSERIRPMMIRVMVLKNWYLDYINAGMPLRHWCTMDPDCPKEIKQEIYLCNRLKFEYVAFFESREELLKKGDEWAESEKDKARLHKVVELNHAFFSKCKQRIIDLQTEIEKVERKVRGDDQPARPTCCHTLNENLPAP